MIETFTQAKSEFYALAYKWFEAEASSREVGEDIILLAREVRDGTGFGGEVKWAYENDVPSAPVPVQALFRLVAMALGGAEVTAIGEAVPYPGEGEMAQEWAAVVAEGEKEKEANNAPPDSLRKLILEASTCWHGEIFAESIGGDCVMNLVGYTNSILPEEIEMRDDCFEPGEEGWEEIPEFVGIFEEAMAWWVTYFNGNPCHAEYAASVVNILMTEGKYDQATEILTICKGTDGFDWDS